MANPANSTAYRGQDDRQWVDVTEAKTLTVDDCGFVQNVTTDGTIVSVPATATLGYWIIRNGGDNVSGSAVGSASDGSCLVQVSPVAADKLQGGVAGTATDNKDLINTKATSEIGDEVCIVNVGETNGPLVAYIKGIWAREA